MKIACWLTIAIISIFGASLLQASDAAGPGNPAFNIGIDGWNPFQSFLATTNTDNTDSEFTSGEGGTCLNGGSPPTCDDPNIHFNVGGDPIPVDSTFGFTADDDGGGSFDFVNDGPPITNVLITTTISSDQQNELFTCSSTAFTFCGFSDPDETLEIFFSNSVFPDGIPSVTTPEPASYAVILIAFGAMLAARRIRSSRAA